MKKIVFLLILAAGVGFLISKTNPKQTEKEQEAPPGETAAPSQSDKALSATRTFDTKEAIAPPAAQSVIKSTPHRNPQETSETSHPETNRPKPSPAKALSDQPKIGSNYTNQLDKARNLLNSEKLLEARRILTQLYLSGSTAVQNQARNQLRRVNDSLVFNPHNMAGARAHTVQPGDTLTSIAKEYGINWRCIQRVNDISRPEMIRVGQTLKILTGNRKILVSKSDFTLTLFIDGYFVKEYPVGLGKNNKTPTGTSTIDSMLIKPVWYRPEGGMVKYGEKGYLIGKRWLGLEDKPGAAGYGIHGTNDPSSVGKQLSNGCIRMRNEDVIELFDFVNIGTTVKIMD